MSMELKVSALAFAARDVLVAEFRSPSGGALPPFEAGAHIDLHLPNGMVRSYSLVGPSSQRDRYTIAIGLDASGRGGSRWIHENLRLGMHLEVGGPRNHFALVKDASHVVFFAGGIGITPILCMLEELKSSDVSWDLHYFVRDEASAAFLKNLVNLIGPRRRLHTYFTRSNRSERPSVPALVSASPLGAHLYCCGPRSMIDDFERATEIWPRDAIHIESFAPAESANTSGGYQVVLAKTGRVVFIPPGKTILNALLDEGIFVPFSCMEGVCGECRTNVIEGRPDHRDIVLSDGEREQNTAMMICCSGSHDPRLVLDL